MALLQPLGCSLCRLHPEKLFLPAKVDWLEMGMVVCSWLGEHIFAGLALGGFAGLELWLHDTLRPSVGVLPPPLAESWWQVELRQVVLGTGTADLVESLMQQLDVAGLLWLSATCEQARHGSPRLQAVLAWKYKASPLTGRVCRVRGDGSDWFVPNPRMLNGWQESRTASARIRLKAPQVYTICCGADGTGAETLWGSPRMTSRSERFRGIGGV